MKCHYCECGINEWIDVTMIRETKTSGGVHTMDYYHRYCLIIKDYEDKKEDIDFAIQAFRDGKLK